MILGDRMKIEEQFNLIAKEYDEKRKLFIPCFEEYYGETTAFFAANINVPGRILDLGAGTGILSAFWYRWFPEAEYLLVDIAEEMLQIAKKRFDGLSNVSCEIADYSQGLPVGEFDVILSALSIHHLDDDGKAALFSRIYDKLPVGGLFVNYDQFCAGTPELNCWFDSYWERRLECSGLTDTDLAQWKVRRKLDRECSVEEETAMLCGCGFGNVKCVYANQKFAVIAAIK